MAHQCHKLQSREKEKAKFWHELISLRNSTNFTMIKGNLELRQGGLKNSKYRILADYNENDLWPIEPLLVIKIIIVLMMQQISKVKIIVWLI